MAHPVFRSFDDTLYDVQGKSILVTGGTGSFGRAFVRRLLSAKIVPDRLVVFSRDEQKQDTMAHDLRAEFPDKMSCMRFFIGDVRDLSRLEMATHDIDAIVHAAALKIVPAAEYNPFECILTNVHGAENVVKAALRSEVEKVISLSTDKAANPINLYGASKLAADKIMVAANNLSGKRRTRFSVVRYGNVLGSRGSVVPYFEKLVRDGAKELPITDKDMTRFWITLDQGVAFVLSSLELMRGGEIFVPKIPSMKIVDLAKAIAPHLEHKFVGIRPGEKLHELMITEDDARMTVDLGNRYAINPSLQFIEHRPLEGQSVPGGFSYASNKNAEWLDAGALLAMLGRKAA